jgi:hypothetical protein
MHSVCKFISQGVVLRWDIMPFQGQKNENPKPERATSISAGQRPAIL